MKRIEAPSCREADVTRRMPWGMKDAHIAHSVALRQRPHGSATDGSDLRRVLSTRPEGGS